MTTAVDICNRALLVLGSQRTISSLTQDSVEAKACNQIYTNARDDLLRMAPWDCGFNTANLRYITSVPGTPENTSPAATLWQKGIPAPPWAYEYQYPVDCLRACWITPQAATGYGDSIPITTAVTGGAPTTWLGGPIRFKVGVDQFIPVISAVVNTAGTNGQYNIGDQITLAYDATTLPPIGAPAALTITGATDGFIDTVSVNNQVVDSNPRFGGSYFAVQTNPIAQGTTSGAGLGATFNLTFGSTPGDQRVILTNQEFAILNYVKQVIDPNVFDTLFQSALQNVIAAQLVMALVGDKNLANQCIAGANASILEARKADGNEGLTINDVTPDWIRVRGVCWTDTMTNGPYSGFDWGGLWNGWA